MTPIYILLAVLGLWGLYRLILMAFYAIKMGIAQASALEKQFGTDVKGAALYSLGLSPEKETPPNAND